MNFYLNQIIPSIDDFSFRSMRNPCVKDALIIHHPSHAICESPVMIRSSKSLEEHILYIQNKGITDAIIVAEDISFLERCSSLNSVTIIPAISAVTFDYSPLYTLPNISWLQCEVPLKNSAQLTVDCGKLKGLECLRITGWGAENFAAAKKLKTLYLNEGRPDKMDLEALRPQCPIENLVINNSKIISLSGISCAYQLRRLELSYNKKLQDISELASLKNTLSWLDIDNCNAIKDFSVLSCLDNLELLRLSGTKAITSLDFVSKLTKLKCLVIMTDVIDGNMGVCTNIPYVVIRNRKHFTHNNKDFSKDIPFPLSISSYE